MNMVRRRAEGEESVSERRWIEGLGDGVAKKGMSTDARSWTESETGTGQVCASEDSEHARFIFTPLMGPCVAIMKRKLGRVVRD
jgi:hypothetical protein